MKHSNFLYSPVALSALLAALPLAAAMTGCGAPSTAEDSDPKSYIKTDAGGGANGKTTEAASTADDASTSTADATDASTSAGGANSSGTGAGGASTGKYRVVDEANPGMTPEAVAALKKFKTPPPATMKAPDKARVRLATSKGDITVELNGKAAPLHVKSFLHLAGRKFFDGTRFHRYEPGFVIQGGDPLTKDAKLQQFFGQGGPGYQIPREYSNLTHNEMVLSAARTSDPDSAGSQFYITLAPAHFLDKDQAQDGYGYTVFGKVTSGSDVVLKLRAGDSLRSATVLK